MSDAERDLLFRLAGHAAPGSDLVPSRVTASVQRLLDRFSNTPVAGYDAAGTLIVANAPHDALMGETSTWRGSERNTVWRNFVGPGTRTVHTREEQADFDVRQLADLRLTAARYPADRFVRRLVQELMAPHPSSATPPDLAGDPSPVSSLGHVGGPGLAVA